MSKRIEHLSITFPQRGWQGEDLHEGIIALEESSGATVFTEGGYPFVCVGAGNKWGDDWSVIVMSAAEATQLKDALVKALARIGRMKPKQTAAHREKQQQRKTTDGTTIHHDQH